MSAVTQRIWIAFGAQVREARLARRWTIRDLALRAGVSPGMVYRVESGAPASTQTAERLAHALGRRVEMQLIDPRRRPDARPALAADPVHSAMGEMEAAHLRRLGYPLGTDEPYQHYQFAGRADLVAWDEDASALLHIENRTGFPDFQEMAGGYNSKRAYLAESLGERIGVARWASQTHVIAAFWSSEVLHALRLRRESFRSLCPDPTDTLMSWWNGHPPPTGNTSVLIVLDPLASGRERAFIGLDDALAGARPRHRGYAAAAARLLAQAS